MALSLRLSWLPRWRDRRQGQRYKQYLLEGNVLVRSAPLLPHLERLPLQVQAAMGGEALPLSAALDTSPRIRLISPPSSGRRLVIRQLCLQWAQGHTLAHNRVPLLLNLQPTIPPLDLICRELALLGFEHDPLVVKRMLAAGMWLVLIEGWEELPATDQLRWQEWCNGVAARYPMLALVVVTGPLAEPWAMFEDWNITGWDG